MNPRECDIISFGGSNGPALVSENCYAWGGYSDTLIHDGCGIHGSMWASDTIYWGSILANKTTKATALPRSSHNGRSALAAPHSAKVFCPISRGLPKVPHKKAGVENQAEKLEMKWKWWSCWDQLLHAVAVQIWFHPKPGSPRVLFISIHHEAIANKCWQDRQPLRRPGSHDGGLKLCLKLWIWDSPRQLCKKPGSTEKDLSWQRETCFNFVEISGGGGRSKMRLQRVRYANM